MGTVAIREQRDEHCDLCGSFEECRPYGPNGENVCFGCGMKDGAAALRQFQSRLEVGDRVFFAKTRAEWKALAN